MTENNKNDEFWDLSEYANKSKQTQSIPRSFSNRRTSAIEINDSKINLKTEKLDQSDTMITKFIPPHSDANFIKKNIIFEYKPQNPLIEKVTVYSDKENSVLFISDNLFIRERRALIDRTTTFKEYVPFYSYSPRYSQLNKAQLNWYIWWRQNARNGNFIKTDESYVLLYAYELAATPDSEDRQAALDMLCSLITSFSSNELGIVYKIMIRDIICDYCLINNLPSPTQKLSKIERQVLFGSFLPEFFVDFSQNKESCVPILASTSLYDYKRSKCYNDTNADTFKIGIDGAINAVINNDDAFNSITSFTKGVYSGVTVDRHPFPHMVNVVNKSIKIEVVYYELSNIKSAITDIVRYSENKIRDHLGIKNKLHVLTVNPAARIAVDSFFEENLPARPVVDRRRKDARMADESHDYDVLYDVPKVEISPERALEIDRESWDTTRKLTEAFADVDTTTDVGTNELAHSDMNQAKITPISSSQSDITEPIVSDEQSVYVQLCNNLGDIAQFVNLCRGSSLLEQRKFASSHGMSCEELVDKINESAAELFGDIILEDNGERYVIIEDYLFLFN